MFSIFGNKKLISVIALVLVFLLVIEVEAVNEGNTWQFDYTGEYQEWEVPKSGTYRIRAWGAQGHPQRHPDDTRRYGGFGGLSEGEIYLDYGTKLNIFVGERGSGEGDRAFNGGGAGGTGRHGRKPGGGGASDIRIDGLGLNDRILVAGGGGGASGDGIMGGSSGALRGGDGGGLQGGWGLRTDTFGAGSEWEYIEPGTQTSGYSLGQGEDGMTVNNTTSHGANGGGGGGYYGGYGGYNETRDHGDSGGGGSSYISGHSQVTPEIHSSGYFFENIVMEKGVNQEHGKVEIELVKPATSMEAETKTATNTNYNSTALNGEITQIEGVNQVDYGFQWREVGGSWSQIEVGTSSEEVDFDYELENLQENTTYEFRSWAEGTYDGEEYRDEGNTLSFTTDQFQHPTITTHEPIF